MNMQIAGAYHNYFLIRSKNTSLNEALCGYMRHESNTHSDKTLIARFLFDLFSVVSRKIFSSVIIFTSNYKLPGTITRNAHTPVLQSLLDNGYLYNVDIMQHSKHHFTQRYQGCARFQEFSFNSCKMIKSACKCDGTVQPIRANLFTF